MSKWTAVTPDTMPEVGVKVLVMDFDNFHVESATLADNGGFYFDDSERAETVDYWQPIGIEGLEPEVDKLFSPADIG